MYNIYIHTLLVGTEPPSLMDGWIYPEWDDPIGPISDGQLKMDLNLSYIARILRFSWFIHFPQHVTCVGPKSTPFKSQVGHCWNPFARCPPQ